MTQTEHAAGLTLVELMVSLAILAILAAPSWQAYQRSATLAAATSDLVSLLASARSEALKRNTDVLLAPLQDDDWSQGWHLFVDNDFSSGLSDGDLTLRISQALHHDHLRIVSNFSQPVRYLGSGFAAWGGTLELQRTDVPATQWHGTRRIIISTSGRVRVCTPSRDPDPDCKAPS
jgi:type IV fimbrial biogenesis protein FimT